MSIRGFLRKHYFVVLLFALGLALDDVELPRNYRVVLVFVIFGVVGMSLYGFFTVERLGGEFEY